MIVKHFYDDSIAQSAYLVGCAATGDAIVIDPTIDIRRYLDAADAEGLRITAVTETHIHADFVSGARALANATAATLYVSGEGGPDWQYGFANDAHVQVVRNGDTIQVGKVRLQVLHTPGHTPEHIMFVVTDAAATSPPGARPEAALGAFTGDFLFVGDIGRPDLLETAAGQIGTMESSARRLFASLRMLDALPDHLVIWPGHGRGSACGKSLSGVPVSSLGYERLTNWALRERNEEAFVRSVLADQPDPPMYFGEMKRVNKLGTPASFPERPLPAATVADVRRLVPARTLVIDLRHEGMAESLPGAIAIPFGRSFSTWAGSIVPASEPFFLIASGARQAAAARRALAVVGRTAAAGWISPGTIAEYRAQGGSTESLQIVQDVPAGYTIVDVRTSAEWRGGHLAGAVHVPLARLPERVGDLDRSSPVLVYCEAGVRSAVGATAMRRLGFTRVASLAGGLSGLRARTAGSVEVGG